MKKQHKNRNKWIFCVALLSGAFLLLSMLAEKKKESPSIDDDNPYLSAKGDGGEPREGKPSKGFYGKCVKRIFDKAISFFGLLALAPLYGLISLAVYLDDPGPVLFTQKRVGKGGHFIEVHKFRTMKMSTPHDVPTHLLENPDGYITRVGRFLRKSSLDELPQIGQVFLGKMRSYFKKHLYLLKKLNLQKFMFSHIPQEREPKQRQCQTKFLRMLKKNEFGDYLS